MKQGLPDADDLGREDRGAGVLRRRVRARPRRGGGEDRSCPPRKSSGAMPPAEYRVLMVGFAPGHPYIGGLDAKLAVPRRAAPRALVPAGSVAIANEQTVVYPYAISGGWNVIGRTPLAAFDATRLRAEPVRRRRPRALPRRSRGASSIDLLRAAMSIRVLRPGLLTTVQDFGRHGHQHVGLCPGGAMDPVSLALANALVGNPPGAAALEITVIGPELLFEHDTLVALCGAEFQGGFPHNRPVLARAGAALPRRPRDARRARLPRGGRRLRHRAGARQLQHLPAGPLRRPRGPRAAPRRRAAAATTDVSRERFAVLEDAGTATACAGRRRRSRCPTASRSWCTPSRASTTPASTPPRSAPSSTRCGASRRTRTAWAFASAGRRSRAAGRRDEILSGPTCLGSVQVPPSGVPIALMADHQTTGGYPRIAEIVAADVPRARAARAGRHAALRAVQPRDGARAAARRGGAARRGAALDCLGVRE